MPYTHWVPKINDCFILGERRHESSAGSPKIFDLLGCFSTMTRRQRSIRPHCRTRAISFMQPRHRTRAEGSVNSKFKIHNSKFLILNSPSFHDPPRHYQECKDGTIFIKRRNIAHLYCFRFRFIGHDRIGSYRFFFAPSGMPLMYQHGIYATG